MRKGDAERGSLLIFVTSRGRHVAMSGARAWDSTAIIAGRRRGRGESAGSVEIADFLAKRARFDEDLWAIELDIAEPERFIAETTSNGLTPPLGQGKPRLNSKSGGHFRQETTEMPRETGNHQGARAEVFASNSRSVFGGSPQILR